MPLPTHDTIPELFPTDAAADLAALDSLANTAARDSVAIFSEASQFPAEVWDAAAVYGPASESIPTGVAAEAVAGLNLLADNTVFQLVVLALTVLYCLTVYFYRDQILMCFKGLVNFKPEDKFTAEHGHLYNNFIIAGSALCILAAGIGLTKAAAVTAPTAAAVSAAIPPGTIATLPWWALPAVGVGFCLIITLTALAQGGILRAAGKLTFSTAFNNSLAEAKAMHLAAAAIVVTPGIILYSGLNPTWDTITAYVTAGLVITTTTAFLLRTFLLFVRQKVSLLVWILYLCAVEIFPFALIGVLWAKNF